MVFSDNKLLRRAGTLGFWLLSYILLLNVFSRTGSIRIIDAVYTLLFHLPLMATVTIHSNYHIPRLLGKKNYTAYLFTLPALIGAGVFLYFLLFDLRLDSVLPGMYFVAVYSFAEMAGIISAYLLLSSLIYFSGSWFQEQNARKKLAEVEAEKVNAELRALRAQINPHFLFNSLNSIYNEALMKSDKTGELILQLSDMLRYVVDNMDREKVPLTNELNYLRNYIALQKQRLNFPGKVTLRIQDATEEKSIAPLLLLNFIENCFMHADMSVPEGFIDIRAEITGNRLKLECRNSVQGNGPESDKEKAEGTGLQNARRRLDLVYPGAYALENHRTETEYILKLKLEIDS